MLPKFIGRERELEFLRGLYRKKGFFLVVVYGRRRVGKTELLKHFLAKVEAGAYILATDDSLEENIKGFKAKFYELTGKDYFLKLETDSFYELFKYLLDALPKSKRVVIVIDEFSYLLSLNKGLLSLFQKIVDELLMKSEVMLILCGSSMFENDILGYKSPLYGRKLNSWKLQPLGFPAVYEFVGDIEQAMLVYFTFGNIPYYLTFYDFKEDLWANIKQNFLMKGQGLYDEPLILLRQEFRESRTYRLILKYISLGYKSLGKLCSACGLDKSNLMKYLSTLEETRIIRHVVPFGQKRKGYYEIVDPFFRFWFRFVYPHRDKLEVGNIAAVEGVVRKEANAVFGICFEYLVEELLNLGFFPELGEFSYIGKWWHKEHEIDIIAVNESSKIKKILLVECKWQERVNAQKLVGELAEKALHVKWHNEGREESYAVFAKSFSKKVVEFNGRKVYCYDLQGIGTKNKL